ncbi:MAG: AAA family ATPase [Ottowia sp.]|nr:AAA family ATPase [Ottowia sp.]
MEILTDDDIDFSRYEHETETQERVKPASVWVAELIENLRNPVKTRQQFMPWRKTQGLIQFRPGEVTVWGGANGAGKSLVTGMVALGLLAQKQRVCIASFEMKPRKTLERMARQWSGFNPEDPAFAGSREAKDELLSIYEEFKGWTEQGLWLYDQQGTVTAKKVCAVVRYCATEKRISHFFIDSLMKCVGAEDDYNGQKAFVDELTAIARDHDMHIHLVHHIRKPNDESHKPNKYDYKGTGAITDQVDNVVSVWRNKPKEKKREAGEVNEAADPDALLICDKQRNGDWEGAIGLWYDRQSQQYLGAYGDTPMDLRVHREEPRFVQDDGF